MVVRSSVRFKRFLRPARACDLRGECRRICCTPLRSRGSTLTEGYLELRQAGAAASTGDRSRTRRRRAWCLTGYDSPRTVGSFLLPGEEARHYTVDLGTVRNM